MSTLLDQVRSAIAVLQQGGGASTLEASQFLSAFEHSVEAWSVAWELVNGDGNSNEDSTYRFFGAKIIYSKIQRDFDQLGTDQIAEFTQSLVSRAIDLSQKYGEETSFVVGRYLCLSIAAMALQVNREGVVAQILIWFNPILDSAPRLMLELLLLLPEECNNDSINVDDDTRDVFAVQLTDSFGDVMAFLQNLWASPACSESTKCKILKCLGAWVESTFVQASLVASQELYSVALECLYAPSPDLVEVAVEVIISTFERFGSANHDILARSWPRLVGLGQLWQQASSSPDCSEGDPAFDVCKQISRVLSQVGENCQRFFLTPSDDAGVNEGKLNFLLLLMECCKHPEDDISTIPINFVCDLVEALTESYLSYEDEKADGGGRGRDGGDGSRGIREAERWQYVNSFYFPHLVAFLQTCTLQCARKSVPCMERAVCAVASGNTNIGAGAAAGSRSGAGVGGSSGEYTLSNEEQEQRKPWLEAAAEVCSLVDRVHGPDAPFHAMAGSLRQVVETASAMCVTSSQQVAEAANALANVEAHLYLLSAALPFIDRSEAQAAPWLFETVILAPCAVKFGSDNATVSSSAVPQLFVSIIRSLGSSCRWITNPALGARYLPQAMSSLSSQLSHGLFQAPAAAALKETLMQCGHIGGAQEEAMKIHTVLLEARRTADLPLTADLHVLEGICDVIGAFSGQVANNEDGEQQLMAHVSALVDPMLGVLAETIGLPPPPPNSSPAVAKSPLRDPNRFGTGASPAFGAPAGAAPDASGSEGKTRDGVISSLERLCVVLRCLRLPPELYMNLLQHQVLSLLQGLLDQRPYSSQLCEKVCRCYKHAMRNASTAFAPLLQPLVHHLTVQFSRHYDAGFLYIIAVSVGEYGRGCAYNADQPPGPLLINAVTSVTNLFFQRFNSPAAFEQSPDVVEEYFCLLQKMLQVAPALYFSVATSGSEVASSGRSFADIVYPAAVAALQTSHHDVHKGVASFFSTLVSRAEPSRRQDSGGNQEEAPVRSAALHQLRTIVGAPLVVAILKFLTSNDSKVALGGDTDKLGTLLLSLQYVIKRDEGASVGEFARWLQEAAAALDAMPAQGSASGGTEGSTRMRPAAAIAKGKVCELILRGEENSVLDAIYRAHRNCVGGKE